MVKIKTGCRIPIWRTFGRIQWHVISEPLITFRGAATWRIQCRDPRFTCHMQGAATWRIQCPDPSATCHIAGCKNSIRHIENRYSPYFICFFYCSLSFDKRRLSYRLRYTCSGIVPKIQERSLTKLACGCLVLCRGGLPVLRWSPTQALTKT